MYKRSEKVGEAIHEMVTELLIKGLKDPRIGFVTITGVKVTDDLHLATVYFSVMGDDDAKKATEAGLNSARGFMRREMGKNLRMRYIPDLVFKYDHSLEQGNRIDQLLREIGDHERRDDTEDK
jgi:ribosome-binding factor A